VSSNPAGAPHLRRLVAIEGRLYAGLTPAYREHVIPTYRLLLTALGSASDAEAATEKVCFRILLNVTYPAPVGAVAELVAAAAAQAVGDYWRGEYGVEAGTWHELAGGIGAVREGADDLDRLLAPAGIRSRSLLLEWATRCSGVDDLAEAFGISAMHVRELLFYGLLQAGAGAGTRPHLSAAVVRTDRVIAYVEDLAASRRPRRFRAAREEAFALVAAARIQGAVRGLDAPRKQFILDLEQLLEEADRGDPGA
jgi:DNA-directed RNA polymerase specialized sigma24 family protein